MGKSSDWKRRRRSVSTGNASSGREEETSGPEEFRGSGRSRQSFLPLLKDGREVVRSAREGQLEDEETERTRRVVLVLGRAPLVDESL